jgi:hypothetical protein
MNVQRRFTSGETSPVTLQQQTDALPSITGYAAVFYQPGNPGTEYRLGRGLVERILPTAFDRALRERDDVRAAFNHDANLILARVKSGTLRLTTDRIGLRYTITPGNTSVARDVVESIRRGDISGSSFSFSIDEKRGPYLDPKDKSRAVVEIVSVHLFDVGPVTYPAYEATTAGTGALGAESHSTDAEANARRLDLLSLRRRRLVLMGSSLRWREALDLTGKSR